MKLQIVDDIQDGIHVTARVNFAGEQWDTQVDIDAVSDLRKHLAALRVVEAEICPQCGTRIEHPVEALTGYRARTLRAQRRVHFKK